MIRPKIWLAAGAVGLVLALFAVLLNAGRGNAVISVEIAERREVPVVKEFAAHLEAAATVEVRANVEGRLTQMSFLEGNMVQKGQILFRIDPRRCAAAVQLAAAAVERAEADLEMAREQQHLVNAQSALRQAEANLLRSSRDLERMKPLAARRAVPQRDLDAAIAEQSSAAAAVEDARATVRTTSVSDRIGLRQAQANLTAARAAQKSAELDLEETTIRAPIGGLIGRAELSAGNYVDRGERNRLAAISPLDPINVDFSMPETYYLHTASKGVDHAALNVELILPDNSVYPFRGRYTNIGSTVDEKNGTIVVQAQFPNPKGILLPGMSGRVRMTAETQNAVLVPEQAVTDIQGSKAVYVVTPEHKVALRKVTVGGSYQGRSAITEGLGGGEAVIVDGAAKLRPGQSVTPQIAQAARAR